MSVTGIPQDHPDRILKKSFHRRNDSGELDVFEAARYFSGYNEASGGYNGSSFTQKIIKEDHSNRGWRGGRISLDMPIRHVLNPHQQSHHHQYHHHHQHHHHQAVNMDHNQIIKDSKKYKQPSSPGGRLASFLNSLFSQSTSKKKKSKSSSTQSMKDLDQEESPGGGRRKRRSSISHFRSSSAADSKPSSVYSSSSSGFRTPPAYAQTPTKSYKDFKSFAKQNKNNNNSSTTTTTSTNNGTHVVKPSTNTTTTTAPTNDDHVDEVIRDHKDLSWLKESNKSLGSALMSENKDKIWDALEHKYPSDLEKKLGLLRRFDDEDHDDDGADSDSSSDLFELQNYDLGCYSSGLPVYETTNMDSIKRGAPISNASM